MTIFTEEELEWVPVETDWEAASPVEENSMDWILDPELPELLNVFWEDIEVPLTFFKSPKGLSKALAKAGDEEDESSFVAGKFSAIVKGLSKFTCKKMYT